MLPVPASAFFFWWWMLGWKGCALSTLLLPSSNQWLKHKKHLINVWVEERMIEWLSRSMFLAGFWSLSSSYSTELYFQNLGDISVICKMGVLVLSVLQNILLTFVRKWPSLVSSLVLLKPKINLMIIEKKEENKKWPLEEVHPFVSGS